MIIRYSIIDDQEKRYTFWYYSKEAAIKAFLNDLRYRPEWKDKIKNFRFAQQTTIIHKDLKYEEMTETEKTTLEEGAK